MKKIMLTLVAAGIVFGGITASQTGPAEATFWTQKEWKAHKEAKRQWWNSMFGWLWKK